MRRACALLLICLLFFTVCCPASAEETGELLVFQITCDSADGWSAPIDTGYPYPDFLKAGGVVDTEDKMEGEASLSLVGNPNAFAGPAVNFEYRPEEELDLSEWGKNGELRFWLYTDNPSFHVMHECQLELSSSGGFDVDEMNWSFSLDNLQLERGWNEVVVSTANAGKQGGTIDLHRVNYFRFWCLLMPENVTIKLDDIRFVQLPEGAASESPEEISVPDGPVTFELDCDGVDGWMTQINADLGYGGFLDAGGKLDLDEKMEGSGSLSLVANPYAFAGPAVNFSYIPAYPLDLRVTKETGEIHFWLYTSDPEFHAANECQFEISSSGVWDIDEMTWILNPSNLELKEGWNEVVLKMADATETGGTCDLRNVNYMRFYSLLMPYDTVIKLDDIRVMDGSMLEPNEPVQTAAAEQEAPMPTEEPAQEEPVAPAEESPEQPVEEAPEQKGFSFWWIVLAVTAVVLILVAVVLRKKKAAPETQSKPEDDE